MIYDRSHSSLQDAVYPYRLREQGAKWGLLASYRGFHGIDLGLSETSRCGRTSPCRCERNSARVCR